MSRDYQADVLRLAELRRKEAELKTKYRFELAEVDAVVKSANALEKEIRQSALEDFDAGLANGTIVHGEVMNYTPQIKVLWRRTVRFDRAVNLPLIYKSAPDLLTIEHTTLKQLFKAGAAPWAVPSEEPERYVEMSRKLGDVLIEDEAAKKADASWDVSPEKV